MKVIIWLILMLCFYSIYAIGQNNLYVCGNQFLKKSILDKYPTFGDSLKEKERLLRSSSRFTLSTSSKQITSPIPVIFHIVLNQAQINKLNGITGIEERIDSQIAVINRDYNALNSDSVLIPIPFKPLYANVGIQFALAHTAPNGSSTPGYEIILTDSDGFNLFNGFGSGFGFSSAKYASSGGANAWDPESYINIWVIDMPSAVVGLTVPKSYIGASSNIPLCENGITLSYGVWGVQTGDNQYYLYGKNKGRTLTHELGHLFEIWHTWGDNDGNCPWSGGDDDGIADTPPQSNPTYGCYNFPLFDLCSPSDNGIMFMNYMDYADDSCKYMFTIGQADVMRSMIGFSGESFSLTQHPELTLWPNGSDTQNIYTIYPNPTNSSVAIVFNKVSQNLISIRIINVLGQVIKQINTDGTQSGFYSFDLSNVESGIYFFQVIFPNKIETNKILKI